LIKVSQAADEITFRDERGILWQPRKIAAEKLAGLSPISIEKQLSDG